MRHDKLDRELELILLMTENRSHTVQQLCDRLNISRRNLYYYLDFLRDTGFVVEKHGTTYRIDKSSPFFTKLFRKVHFTEDEAIAMRRLLEQSGAHSAQIEHLKHKLDTLYDLNILADDERREQQALNLSVIYDAIKYKRCVALRRYSSPHSNSVSDRIVEPFMLLNGNNEVRCYEITTATNKTFKLSRVQDVKILDLFWQYEKYHREMMTDIFMFSSESQELVKLRLGRLSASLLREEYPQSERYIEPDGDDHWLVELPVSSFKGIGRFVLGLMEDIDVLENDDFKDYLRQKIQTMKQRL